MNLSPSLLTQKVIGTIPPAILFVIGALFLLFHLTPEQADAQNTYRLNKAPHYKSFEKQKDGIHQQYRFDGVILHPVMKSEFAYLNRESKMQPVADTLTAYINNLSWIESWENHSGMPIKGMPYLYVGSAESDAAPPSAHMLRGEFEVYPPLVMHLDKPSKKWKSEFLKHHKGDSNDYYLVIWLGFSEYPKTDKGLFKKKVVLGTGYEREIRFLSAIDKPVAVLQLTGVLLDHKGNVVRAGAEAFFHEDTPFWAQILDMSKIIDDKTLQNAVLSERREDLPGSPLAWQTALNNLLYQLTQRPALL
jgi:hypothetical protein